MATSFFVLSADLYPGHCVDLLCHSLALLLGDQPLVWGQITLRANCGDDEKKNETRKKERKKERKKDQKPEK